MNARRAGAARRLPGTPEPQPGGELADVGCFTPDGVPQLHTNALRYALADAFVGRRDTELTGWRREY